MNQARKDTTGVKLEVNERFVLYGTQSFKHQHKESCKRQKPHWGYLKSNLLYLHSEVDLISFYFKFNLSLITDLRSFLWPGWSPGVTRQMTLGLLRFL